MQGAWGRYFQVSLLAAVFLLSDLAGCARGSQFDSELVISKSCTAKIDQRDSFMAKNPAFPLKVVADALFTEKERLGIHVAVQQWNATAERLKLPHFFDLRFEALTEQLRAADPRDCDETVYGGADSFVILRESNSPRWTALGFSEVIPGATLRCFRGQWVDHQSVLIYTEVIDPRQFSSVILHELGHVIGLDHSCLNDLGRKRFASCLGLSEDHPYHRAVMFPSLRVPADRSNLEDKPEVKNIIPERKNDDVRVNCLYGP